MEAPMESMVYELEEVEVELAKLRNRKSLISSDIKKEIVGLEKFHLLTVNMAALKQSIRRGHWSVTK